MADEPDPFATPRVGPSFKADFETETGDVDKLSAAMDRLATSTGKVNAQMGSLSSSGAAVKSHISSILSSAGLSTGGAGSGGNNNGGAPTVSGTPSRGNGNGGLAGMMSRMLPRGSGGVGALVGADFALDLMRYASNVQIPGYGRMQKMATQGLPLDAYASQWSGAYGMAPSQIPSRITNGGAIGTSAQVAGAAQYGASMGAIPGVNQLGSSYWSSVNQIQRLAPGTSPEQAAQLSGGLLNPRVNTQIAMRYGMGVTPMQPGGTVKTFAQTAADILKALKRSGGGSQVGALPTKEQLIAGLMPGSRMRQQMRVGMGLDDDTITMIINWGVQNSSYASRGGQGIYDPSDANSRKLANGSGSKDSLSNYALTYQSAQTNQVSNFMQGQYGSMQDMFQVQTDLTNAMTKVDDAFTGLYAIIGPTGPVLAGFVGLASQLASAAFALRAFSIAVGGSAAGAGAGTATGVAGATGAATAGAGGAGATAATGAGAVGGMAIGGAALSAVVQGYQSNQVRSSQGKSPTGVIPNILSGNFNPLDWFGDIPIGDPETAGFSGDFRQKLGAMMAANPNLTVTSGARSASSQGALNRAGVGSVGSAGDSWHVRGKAADLGPPSQFGWLAKNAGKFGLDSGAHFGEPWHVQPRGTAGKRPPTNLAINQSARGPGASYRQYRGRVGDLPGLSMTDIISQGLAVNAGALIQRSSTAGGVGTSSGQPTTAASGGGGQVEKVIAYARAQIGKPYKTNTQGPDSFDCSGLVTAAYKTVGIILPALTFSQVKMGSPVPVDPSAVQPGDCLFMRGGSPATDLGHVAIATSSSSMISAPHTGAFVHEGAIPWNSVQQIRRYVGASSTPGKSNVDTSGSWQDFLNSHMETSGKMDPGAAMGGPQVAAAFYRAGFRGQTLTDIVAISGRESGWNPTAYNFHAKSTGDISLGLVQENVKDGMIARLKDAGLSDPRQLFDPNNAAHAAFLLSRGGTDLSPWGGYKGMSNTFGTNMQSATQAVDQARQQGLIGDIPVATGSGGGGGGSSPSSYVAMSLVGGGGGGGRGHTIVNMNFYISGGGDAQATGMRVAQVAGQALKQQLDRDAVRSM